LEISACRLGEIDGEAPRWRGHNDALLREQLLYRCERRSVDIDKIVRAAYHKIGSSKGMSQWQSQPTTYKQWPMQKNEQPQLTVYLKTGESGIVEGDVDQVKSLLEEKDIPFEYAP
jgi:hypothetical protein